MLIHCQIWWNCTAWNVSKYGVFSGPYFSVFSPNTNCLNTEQKKKLRIWILFTQWPYITKIIIVLMFISQMFESRKFEFSVRKYCGEQALWWNICNNLDILEYLFPWSKDFLEKFAYVLNGWTQNMIQWNI